MKTRIINAFDTYFWTTKWKCYQLQMKKWYWRIDVAKRDNKEELIEMQKNLENAWTEVKTRFEKTQEVKQKTEDHATQKLVYMLKEHYLKRRHQIDIANELWVSQSTVSIQTNKWIQQQIKKEFPTKPQQSSLLS